MLEVLGIATASEETYVVRRQVTVLCALDHSLEVGRSRRGFVSCAMLGLGGVGECSGRRSGLVTLTEPENIEFAAVVSLLELIESTRVRKLPQNAPYAGAGRRQDIGGAASPAARRECESQPVMSQLGATGRRRTDHTLPDGRW